jgi:hypothetical protein
MDCYINMNHKTATTLYDAFKALPFDVNTFTLARVFFYLEIVNANHEQEKNLRGWLNRVRKLYDFCMRLI